MSKQYLNCLIPHELPFPTLRRDPATGDIDIDETTREALIDANPHCQDRLDGEVLAGILVGWYRYVRARGERNAVMEQILAEVALSRDLGQARVQSGCAGPH